MVNHQDIAWMDSIGACEKFRDERMITPTLEIMKNNPNYCFSIEDALELREYLKRQNVPSLGYKTYTLIPYVEKLNDRVPVNATALSLILSR